MIVRILSSIFFTDIGLKERHIGYLNFLGIPYNLKFLWAPLIDLVGSKRSWLVSMQFIVAALTFLITFMCSMLVEEGSAAPLLFAISAILVLMAFFSATNDIAIDAYYIEALPLKSDQAAFSGYRVLAYRLSMIYVRTVLVALVAYASVSVWPTDRYAPWTLSFGVAGATILLFALYNAWLLPVVSSGVEPSGERKGAYQTFLLAFSSYFRQEKVGLILAFLLVYKLGDEILFSMVSPFLLREIGLTKAQFSWVSGIVGAAGNIVGAMAGGYWIKSKGLKRSILPITLIMNVTIWAYIGLAYFKPNPQSFSGLGVIVLIHGYEQFAAGLGGAALLLFLLTTYRQEYKAAHYALGSAIVSVISHVLTGFAGNIVERIGYVWFYVLAFVASLPSLVLLFFVPIKEEQPGR
jgi:MFS transporter, PAT family, beta-lactamase induction signal transducer AmpG